MIKQPNIGLLLIENPYTREQIIKLAGVMDARVGVSDIGRGTTRAGRWVAKKIYGLGSSVRQSGLPRWLGETIVHGPKIPFTQRRVVGGKMHGRKIPGSNSRLSTFNGMFYAFGGIPAAGTIASGALGDKGSRGRGIVGRKPAYLTDNRPARTGGYN